MENMAEEGAEEVSKRKERAVLSQSHANTYDCNKRKLLSMPVEDEMRSSGFENQQERFREDLMKTFLMIVIIKCWNRKKLQSQLPPQTLKTCQINISELRKYSYDLSVAQGWVR